jgi:hypothetical protein
VELTLGIVPLLLKRSLMHECEERVEQAMGVQRQAPAQSPRTEMQLAAAIATSLFHTKGAVQEVDIAWQRTLELALQLNETDHQLCALWGLWSYRISAGDYPGADTLARRFHEIATQQSCRRFADCRTNDGRGAPLPRRSGRLHQIISVNLSQYNEAIHRPHIVRFQYISARRRWRARILWAGLSEQAMDACYGPRRSSGKSARDLIVLRLE